MTCLGVWRATIAGCNKSVCDKHRAPDVYITDCYKSSPILCIECGIKNEKCNKIKWGFWGFFIAAILITTAVLVIVYWDDLKMLNKNSKKSIAG